MNRNERCTLALLLLISSFRCKSTSAATDPVLDSHLSHDHHPRAASVPSLSISVISSFLPYFITSVSHVSCLKPHVNINSELLKDSNSFPNIVASSICSCKGSEEGTKEAHLSRNDHSTSNSSRKMIELQVVSREKLRGRRERN